jgi:Phage integrase family.
MLLWSVSVTIVSDVSFYIGTCLLRLERGRVAAWPDFDLVFLDDEGKQLSSQRFLEEWHTLLQQMGLPRLRFHDLRVLVWRGMLK